jgi:hypothetical protein
LAWNTSVLGWQLVCSSSLSLTARSRRFRILARKIEFGVFGLFRMRKKIFSWKNRRFWWISIYFPHIIRKSVRNSGKKFGIVRILRIDLGKKFGIVRILRMTPEKNSELSEYSELIPEKNSQLSKYSELRSETTTLIRKIISDSEIIQSYLGENFRISFATFDAISELHSEKNSKLPC